jgi:hypothetical protein
MMSAWVGSASAASRNTPVATGKRDGVMVHSLDRDGRATSDRRANIVQAVRPSYGATSPVYGPFYRAVIGKVL